MNNYTPHVSLTKYNSPVSGQLSTTLTLTITVTPWYTLLDILDIRQENLQDCLQRCKFTALYYVYIYSSNHAKHGKLEWDVKPYTLDQSLLFG